MIGCRTVRRIINIFFSNPTLVVDALSVLPLVRSFTTMSKQNLNTFNKFNKATNMELRCNLCSEFVVKNKQMVTPRYGLLDCCPHIFCLTCIRRHVHRFLTVFKNMNRETALKKAMLCPVCFGEIEIIMASKQVILDIGQKCEYKIILYKFLQDLACPTFRRGLGFCFCNVSHDNPVIPEHWGDDVPYACSEKRDPAEIYLDPPTKKVSLLCITFYCPIPIFNDFLPRPIRTL